MDWGAVEAIGTIIAALVAGYAVWLQNQTNRRQYKLILDQLNEKRSENLNSKYVLLVNLYNDIRWQGYTTYYGKKAIETFLVERASKETESDLGEPFNISTTRPIYPLKMKIQIRLGNIHISETHILLMQSIREFNFLSKELSKDKSAYWALRWQVAYFYDENLKDFINFYLESAPDRVKTPIIIHKSTGDKVQMDILKHERDFMIEMENAKRYRGKMLTRDISEVSKV